MRFELYADSAGEWRWRLVAANGRTIADSGEGYSSKAHGDRAIRGILRSAQQLGVAKVLIQPRAQRQRAISPATAASRRVAGAALEALVSIIKP